MKLIPKYQTGTAKAKSISDRIGNWLDNNGYNGLARGLNSFNNDMSHVFSDLKSLGLPISLPEAGAAVMGNPIGKIRIINKTVPKGAQSELVRLTDGTYKRKVGNVLYNPQPYKPLTRRAPNPSSVVNESKRYTDKIINGERIEVGTEFFPDTDILPYDGTVYTYPSSINWNWRSELEKKLGHPFIY